jgi:4-aminobutyrate aminotransferase
VAVAAALATLRLLESGLIANAARVGAHLMTRLRDWPRRFPYLAEVRGLGLMIGIEIVRDQRSREKAPDLRDQLVQMAFERGLLVLGAGESTLRLSPPLIITAKQADFACGVLEQCLAELYRTLRRTAA